jgi:thiamine-phosphate pyrophosphorylase
MAIDTQKLALYLVTDPDLCAPFGLIETVKAAVAGGVSIVQLRDKHASTAQIIQNAMALQPILATHNIPLIINDDVEAAIACGAEGIHVGQDDLDVGRVRQKVGRDKIVGLSVETVEAALNVDPRIVDYIGISPIFATRTKIDHKPPVGFDGLADIVASSPVPSVAIGGLNANHCKKVFAAGSAGIAVVSAICGKDDPFNATVFIRQQVDLVNKRGKK